jgi:hypothetical protein
MDYLLSPMNGVVAGTFLRRRKLVAHTSKVLMGIMGNGASVQDG